MTYRGTVKNGVVILEPDAKLPEGTPVRVETVSVESEHPALTASQDVQFGEEEDPLLRMLNYAGPTGIPDLSINVDHYLYGHPKIEIPKLNDGK